MLLTSLIISMLTIPHAHRSTEPRFATRGIVGQRPATSIAMSAQTTPAKGLIAATAFVGADIRLQHIFATLTRFGTTPTARAPGNEAMPLDSLWAWPFQLDH